MMREDRDRSRSRSGGEEEEGDIRETSPTTPPYRESPEHESEGEEEGVSWQQRRYRRHQRRRIESHRLGPFATHRERDRISRMEQRLEGCMGTGLPNRWRYQHRTPTTQGYQSEDDPLEFDNYVADWLGPDDNVEMF